MRKLLDEHNKVIRKDFASMQAKEDFLNPLNSVSLTPDQQSILQQIQTFIHDSGKQVFILKGAAGSGKTTLIRELVSFLQKERKAFQLMAPTGRAAKILRDKTGTGTTIHRGIYNFDRLESKETDSDDESKKSFHYYFPLHVRAESQIVIVDEASMVSDVVTQHELTIKYNNYERFREIKP